jgi:hypothetical protein
MKCERCNGLVIAMSFVGGDEALGAWQYDGLKCLNCGHITDPLFMRNRALPAQNQSTPHAVRGPMAKAGLGAWISV